MTEKLRMPELQPAHPSDKFTPEEAMAALEAVEAEAEERERRRAQRKSTRRGPRKRAQAADGGGDP
jgi:hypothetical protein